MSDLISVIIPVYNIEKYLRKCLDSVCNQSYRALEILLIDDGSTDNSGTICEEYAGRDARIRVVHKTNGGLSSARNAGMDICSGSYFVFIDSDDYVLPDYVETLYRICTEKDCGMAICGLWEENADRNEDKAAEIASFNQQLEGIECTEGKCLLREYHGRRHQMITVAWNKMYSREVIGDIRYPEGMLYEDEATTFRYLYAAEKVGITEKKLYCYRHRQGSIMQQRFSLRRLQVLEANRMRVRFFRDRGEKELLSVEQRCYLSALLSFYRRVKRLLPEEKEKAKELYQEYRRCYREYPQKGWSLSMRVLYLLCIPFPSLYGILKRQ